MSFSTFEFPNSSYYGDDLRELVRLYNELVAIYKGLQNEIADFYKYVNEFEEMVDQKVKDQIAVSMSLYTQRLIKVEQQVAELTKAIEEFENTIPADISNLYSQIAATNKVVRENFAYLNNKNQELVEMFHEYKNSLDGYIDGKTEELKKYLYDIAVHLDYLDVTNPITGKFEDINKVLAELFYAISVSYGLTAAQYDALQITAGEYDRMRIQAIDYSTKGYFLFWQNSAGMMLSPFTGTKQHFSVIINKLADLHKCTYTAKQYDEMQMTAAEYDAWQVSAFNYDWFGRQLVLRLKGITAAEYDSLKLTAKEYAQRALTASQYDKYGYVLFFDPVHIRVPRCMSCNEDIIKPTTRNVLYGSVKAGVYDSLNKEALPYSELNITAKDYEESGYPILTRGSKYVTLDVKQ